jgi:hypothetical protein
MTFCALRIATAYLSGMASHTIIALGVMLAVAPVAAHRQAAPVGAAQASQAVDAQRFLEKYIALEHAFDPAIADLYGADAVIRTRRIYPTGEIRDLTIPVAQYKELIRQMMPVARAARDISQYSNCSYMPESGRVRVRCTRYSELKQYASPVSFLVGPDASGEWRVFEESSESRQ